MGVSNRKRNMAEHFIEDLDESDSTEVESRDNAMYTAVDPSGIVVS